VKTVTAKTLEKMAKMATRKTETEMIKEAEMAGKVTVCKDYKVYTSKAMRIKGSKHWLDDKKYQKLSRM
jgi:hypothetical protein